MNNKQRIVLIVGLAVIVVMAIFPPWRGYLLHAIPPHEQNAGYAYLFDPPKKGRLVNDYEMEYSYRGETINLPLLITQWGIVTAITGIIVLLLHDRRNS